ncbi:hypothetical protein [Marinobacterium lutimaris]|uniref:Uncharacterized protein n=1 Tax=Marinobacterium lutimaris TaxID=568106 RepID=A0A1H5XX48_9GAMM|nr:hypothetical protein [Marinobacterium lutimaris]SEG16027.1 hypothetical protein SAMN05444390_1011528 [Marinobacterium lutimaris]
MSNHITVGFKFPDDAEIPRELLNLGGEFMGAEIYAAACYDMFKTMEIAEEAIANSFTNLSSDAANEINKVIAQNMKSRRSV